jgi:hypothetical protein
MQWVQQQIQQFITTRSREELFELTYAYTEIDGQFFNMTLFGLYWAWTQYDDVHVLIAQVRELLQTDLNHIKQFRHAVIADERDAPLLYKTIDYMQLVFEQIWRAVPLEAQKYWSDVSYEQYDLLNAFQAVVKRDEMLFWNTVMSDPKDCFQADCLLTWVFVKNETELDQEERQRFQDYLLIMRKSVVQENNVCNFSPEWSFLDDELFSVQIPRQTYIELFTLALQSYNLSIPVITAQRWSIYDWRHALEVPYYDDYATLSFRRILKLIAHEIETHYVVLHNTDLLLWWMKWWFNLAREEGLAKFQEFLLTWLPLEEIRVTDWLPLLLMGEILSTEQFLDFLNLYRKMHGIIASGMLRLLRVKRNYPLFKPWVNHKDVTYSRGLQQIAAYVQWWWNYASLFLSKVDFDDMHIIQNSIDTQKQIMQPIEPLFMALRLVDRMMIVLRGKSILHHYTTQYPFLAHFLQKPLTTHQEQILQKMVTICHNQLLSTWATL